MSRRVIWLTRTARPTMQRSTPMHPRTTLPCASCARRRSIVAVAGIRFSYGRHRQHKSVLGDHARRCVADCRCITIPSVTSVPKTRRTMPSDRLFPIWVSSTLVLTTSSVLFAANLLEGRTLLLGALLARLAVLGGFGFRTAPVVGRVEARPLERHVHLLHHLPERSAALDARGQGVVKELLHHIEDVPVLALELVDRHPASCISNQHHNM